MNATDVNKPVNQEIIDTLTITAQTEEEKEILRKWQEELDRDREAFFRDVASKKLPDLVQLPDGTITTVEEAEDDRTSDNPTTGAYDSGRRA